MEIILPDYIRLQIRERNIPEDWVKETLLQPEQVFESGGGRRIAQRKYFDRMRNKEYLLRVIFIQKENCLIGVTAYLTSQIKKYWR